MLDNTEEISSESIVFYGWWGAIAVVSSSLFVWYSLCSLESRFISPHFFASAFLAQSCTYSVPWINAISARTNSRPK
jgi:hypothetical protein